MGAETITFAGLAGIGDYHCHCTSKTAATGRRASPWPGESLEDIRKGMVVEGVNTTETAAMLAAREGKHANYHRPA